MPVVYDMVKHIARAHKWSQETFGPGYRTVGLCKHIENELKEIQDDPNDVEEWIDVMILSIEGACRCLANVGIWPDEAIPSMVVSVLASKQLKNERRKWPNWRECGQGEPIEHLKGGGGIGTDRGELLPLRVAVEYTNDNDPPVLRIRDTVNGCVLDSVEVSVQSTSDLTDALLAYKLLCMEWNII